MEFLEIPLFDDDLVKLCVRLAINLFFVGIIVAVYFANTKKRQFLFTFLLMNVIVFMICFTLKKFELDLGLALGLFAVFAIIRYRTDAIEVKEMTYLFVVIGLAVINALSNRNTSYAELLFVNGVIVVLTAVLEQKVMAKQLAVQNVLYDGIELLRPDRRADLLIDIKKRTGLDVQRVRVNKIDLKKRTGTIEVFYNNEI